MKTLIVLLAAACAFAADTPVKKETPARLPVPASGPATPAAAPMALPADVFMLYMRADRRVVAAQAVKIQAEKDLDSAQKELQALVVSKLIPACSEKKLIPMFATADDAKALPGVEPGDPICVTPSRAQQK